MRIFFRGEVDVLVTYAFVPRCTGSGNVLWHTKKFMKGNFTPGKNFSFIHIMRRRSQNSPPRRVHRLICTTSSNSHHARRLQRRSRRPAAPCLPAQQGQQRQHVPWSTQREHGSAPHQCATTPHLFTSCAHPPDVCQARGRSSRGIRLPPSSRVRTGISRDQHVSHSGTPAQRAAFAGA